MTKDKFLRMSHAHIGMLTLKAYTLQVMYENNKVFLDIYLKDKIEKDVEEIKKLKDEYDEEIIDLFYEDIGDYNHFSNETSEVLSHYMMVALYSYYEIALKNILKLTKKLKPSELKSLYLFRNVKSILKTKFGVEYEDRKKSSFLLLNELRIINNCIKHGGIVDDNLHAANNEWNIDQEFGDLSGHYIKFEHVPSVYLEELVSEISNSL